MVNNKVEEEQRDYHIALDNDLNKRFLNYLKSEFREGSRVVTATMCKALDEFLKSKGY